MKLDRSFFLVFAFVLTCSFTVERINADVPKSAEDDRSKINLVRNECLKIKEYIVGSKFQTVCDFQYLHFLPTTKNKLMRSSYKIANYNLLHPGTSKTLFKDYKLMASVINEFDIVSAQEVLSVIGHDLDVNELLTEFIDDQATTDSEKKKAKDLYRMPGYLKLLLELKKLDSTWGLVLSPRGDSALSGSVEELLGYFYRGSIANLRPNKYCEEVNKFKSQEKSYACLVSFNLKNKFVSRRPFLASFNIANKDLTLLTSHVVYNYSGTPEDLDELIANVFGVSSIEEIGSGVNSINVARYAEVKLSLEFINKYSAKYLDKKIIFLGDLNLIAENEYWKNLLGSKYSLLVSEATTLSPQRFSKNGEETFGTANSYDHFILEKNQFSNCDNGKVFNYFSSFTNSYIAENYLIRKLFPVFEGVIHNSIVHQPRDNDDDYSFDLDEEIELDYPLTKKFEERIKKSLIDFEKILKTQKTVKNGQIVDDQFQIEERLMGFKNRVYLQQLTNSYFYKVYQELLSDHMPIYLSCK